MFHRETAISDNNNIDQESVLWEFRFQKNGYIKMFNHYLEMNSHPNQNSKKKFSGLKIQVRIPSSKISAE